MSIVAAYGVQTEVAGGEPGGRGGVASGSAHDVRGARSRPGQGTGCLRDQVALVTGGGRGLGQSFACALARAGARVAVVARSPVQLSDTVGRIEGGGGRAVGVIADVAERAAVQEAVAAVETQLGPVDVLVNNAGVGGPVGPLWQSDPDEWWRCMEVNVRGILLCSRAVLPGMLARGRGRIINVSSAAGSFATPNHSAYITSKTAVTRLTEVLAAEVRGRGVAVFAIEPGTVRTALTEGLMECACMGALRNAFAQGRDVSPQQATQLVVSLAGGCGDALSGLLIHRHDKVDEMLAGQQAIRGLGLHVLRLHAYGRRMGALFALLRAWRWLGAPVSRRARRGRGGR
ncbi:MAG: SDR family oxidoreductase [Candidatus Latescibacterota bacterium]